MNSFDDAILRFFNQFTQRSEALDSGIRLLSSNLLFKGGLAMAVIWWLWFSSQDAEKEKRIRTCLLVCLAATMASLAFARAVAANFPFRLRPMYQTEWFQRPIGLTAEDETGLERGSSFPSDHAALFFGLATGIFLVSRRLGLIAFLYM